MKIFLNETKTQQSPTFHTACESVLRLPPSILLTHPLSQDALHALFDVGDARILLLRDSECPALHPCHVRRVSASQEAATSTQVSTGEMVTNPILREVGWGSYMGGRGHPMLKGLISKTKKQNTVISTEGQVRLQKFNYKSSITTIPPPKV